MISRASTLPSSRGLVTTAARSALMKSVRRERTEPERRLRRFLHSRGLRFAIRSSQLPGRPDLVLPRRGTVVFLHGCFWHGHSCAHGSVRARANADYWNAKIADNRKRDRRKSRELRSLGWEVEVVWECDLERPKRLEALAIRLLRR
ncbi:MAG: DNA mismatch endonuclease Vsr [Burkholderiaceae bacterium]